MHTRILTVLDSNTSTRCVFINSELYTFHVFGLIFQNRKTKLFESYIIILNILSWFNPGVFKMGSKRSKGVPKIFQRKKYIINI